MTLASLQRDSWEWLDLHLGLDSGASFSMLPTWAYQQPFLPLLRRSLMTSSCESPLFILRGQLTSLILRQVASSSSRPYRNACYSNSFGSLARTVSVNDWNAFFADIQVSWSWRRCYYRNLGCFYHPSGLATDDALTLHCSIIVTSGLWSTTSPCQWCPHLSLSALMK